MTQEDAGVQLFSQLRKHRQWLRWTVLTLCCAKQLYIMALYHVSSRDEAKAPTIEM